MKKILIVGVSGLLGTKLYQIAREKYEVYGTFNRHEIKSENFFKLDATNRKEVFSLIERLKPDVVFDFHSITDVDYCELHQEEAWDVNVNGTRNITEACKAYRAKIVFISSDYVFDGKKSSYSEKDRPNPLNYYGKTKAIAENIIQLLGTNHIIVRTAVLYGINGHGKKPFPLWVLENLKEGKEIKVVTDQFNNPTLADDLAKILLMLYEKNISGLFHAVGKDNVSRYEFALKVAEIFNLDKTLIKPINSSELKQAALRPRKLKLSTEKLKKVLGIVPVGIEDGLKILKGQIK
jgi:dTDP-4-dehydrorhamnose reductase